MRVAVVDIGTNSTRLLVADVNVDGLAELERRSVVTQLGEGVEATGQLGEEPQRRVFAALDGFAELIDRHACEVRTAVMTSAVRDAANGPAFAATVRARYGLEGKTLSGDEEARLTFLGATAARDPADPHALLVIDIGGGSTELVVGAGGRVRFYSSTQVGVVRHTERHIAHDPPGPEEILALAEDTRAALAAAVPPDQRDGVAGAVAVAGTATSVAAIDLELVPYDPAAVEGHVISVATLETQLAQLAAVGLEDRRRTPGLHPDRAPTIVAGVVVLVEALRLFHLDRTEVSERDILWGVALDSAH